MFNFIRRAKLFFFTPLIILAGISLALIPNAAYAESTGIGLYNDCYFGDDFGDKKKDRITVRPIGKICHERCEIECSGLMTDKIDISLNMEELIRCKKNCRLGNKSSSYTLKYKDAAGNIQTKAGVKILSACGSVGSEDSLAYNIYESSFVVQSNDQIVVKIRSVPNLGYGRLSLCGTQSKTITPVFQSAFASDWNSNNIWNNRTTAPETWSAKNKSITNTGIDLRNGDIVNITLESENGYFPCSNTSCKTWDMLIRKPFAGSTWDPGGNSNSIFETLPGGQLTIIKQNSNGDFTRENGSVIDPVDLGNILEANSKVSWRGLFGKSDTVPNIDENGKISGTKQVIRFSGRIEGFSDRYTRLGITHFDSRSGGSDAWDNNIGGLKVSIERQGCIYEDGERLVYAVLGYTSDSTPEKPKFVPYFDPSVTWRPLTEKNLKGYEPIVMDTDGKLVFMIDVPVYDQSAEGPQCPIADPICRQSVNNIPIMYGFENTNGHYNIQVEKANVDKIGSNGVSDIIRNVKIYLYGNGENRQGIVQEMFNDFVSETRFVQIIQAALLLFMTWTGFSYVIGISQITQRDGLIRIITFAIVIILINPNSWEFFNTYLFGLFVDGGGVLISHVINYQDFDFNNEQIETIRNDPGRVFTMFDKVFTIVSSQAFWYKIGALLFSGWLGIYVFLAIAFGVAIFTIALIKTFIIYMVSMVMMGILLLLAPIFITFLLFKYTRKMFMSWLGQLISVTLQPVIVIAAVGIFTNLFLAGIYAALGFTACRICFLGVAFPVVLPFTCILPGFTTINAMHAPDDAILVSPITNLAAGFYIFIIAHAMYVFVDFSVRLVNTMVSQNFFTGIDLSGYANVSDYTTGIARRVTTPISTVLGTSDRVQGARRNIDAPAAFMASNYQLGRSVGGDTKSFPKVAAALREASTQSGVGGLSDKQFATVMNQLGDKAKILESSDISRQEIREVLLSSIKEGEAVARGSMVFNHLVEGKSHPKLAELLEKAEGGNLKRDYPKVSRAVDMAVKNLKGEDVDVSNKRLIREFEIMGDRAKALEKANTVSDTDLANVFINGIAWEARGYEAPKEYGLNRLMDKVAQEGQARANPAEEDRS